MLASPLPARGGGSSSGVGSAIYPEGAQLPRVCSRNKPFVVSCQRVAPVWLIEFWSASAVVSKFSEHAGKSAVSCASLQLARGRGGG